LSVWRLARDDGYAQWAVRAALESAAIPKACQISFFGMETNTDWGARKRGAFSDNLLATERLLGAGIAPRWQLFVTKRCLGELDDFTRLIYEKDLFKRCEAIGHKFEVFINNISPEGNGYDLIDFFIDEDDLAKIPRELLSVCRGGADLWGQPEYALLEALVCEDAPCGLSANVPSVSVNAGFDVYPNIAEPAEWWRLGNLYADGADAVLKAYRDETAPGMRTNREIPARELARRYGDKKSNKLYQKDDLLSRFLHEWGVDYMKGRR